VSTKCTAPSRDSSPRAHSFCRPMGTYETHIRSFRPGIPGTPFRPRVVGVGLAFDGVERPTRSKQGVRRPRRFTQSPWATPRDPFVFPRRGLVDVGCLYQRVAVVKLRKQFGDGGVGGLWRRYAIVHTPSSTLMCRTVTVFALAGGLRHPSGSSPFRPLLRSFLLRMYLSRAQ